MTKNKNKKTYSENKVSKKSEKDVKVEEEVESFEEETTETKKEKEYTPVPSGKGGQFVDIGGGIKVLASEIDQN